MQIKTLKKKGSNLYEITLNTKETILLYDEVILNFELLIDKNIDSKKLEELKKENAKLDGYYKALKYIAKKMRSSLEIEEYLKKNEFDKTSIDYAITRLKKEGYLNEKNYVDAYINDAINLSSNGPKKIKSSLLKLGISETLIDEKLETISSSVWQERINKIISKKFKVNKKSAALFKNKIYSDLVILGYYSDDIKAVINNFDFNTDDVFQKEADKVWCQLSKKFEGSELVYKFKNKMFLKGFSYEEISSYIEKKD